MSLQLSTAYYTVTKRNLRDNRIHKIGENLNHFPYYSNLTINPSHLFVGAYSTVRAKNNTVNLIRFKNVGISEFLICNFSDNDFFQYHKLNTALNGSVDFKFL